MARKSKRAAGLIDCRIHQDCHRTHSSESDQHPRRISLSAIGRCLKDQYDALASPIPPHLAALVKRLGMQHSQGNGPTRQPRQSADRPRD
jgi:hypothetical protein